MRIAPHWDAGGIPVSLSGIESALNGFWRTQAQNGEQALLRAGTLTLILVARNETQFQSALQAVSELVNHHPGRMILIRLIETNPGSTVEAFISAHCQLSPQGGKQLCCEQITLICPAFESQKLPGILLPLLLPDLPVFLWWPGALQEESHDFRILWKYIDRLIIKTPEEPADWPALQLIARQIQFKNEQVLVTDLTWARMTAWREALAQFFDGPEGPELLKNISHIRIETDTARFSATSAWLLAWLSTLLKWYKIPSSNLVFQGMAREIEATVHPSIDSAIRSSSLTGVELTTEWNGQVVHLWVRRKNKTDFECGNSSSSPYILRQPDRDDIQLLCQELDFLQSDELFIKICRALSVETNVETQAPMSY